VGIYLVLAWKNTKKVKDLSSQYNFVDLSSSKEEMEEKNIYTIDITSFSSLIDKWSNNKQVNFSLKL
jgi:hypothetical protein